MLGIPGGVFKRELKRAVYCAARYCAILFYGQGPPSPLDRNASWRCTFKSSPEATPGANWAEKQDVPVPVPVLTVAGLSGSFVFFLALNYAAYQVRPLGTLKPPPNARARSCRHRHVSSLTHDTRALLCPNCAGCHVAAWGAGPEAS